MQEFVQEAREACEELLHSADILKQRVIERVADLDREELEQVKEADERFEDAIDKITFSLTLIEQTALDVVDMETRMADETDQLLSVAHQLEKAVLGGFLVQNVASELAEVEEKVQDLACALFPSAAEGLADVNRILYKFTRREWSRYRRLLERAELDANARPAVERTFAELKSAFDETNEFLNRLALNEFYRAELSQAYQGRVAHLDEAAALAERAKHDPSHRDFRPVLATVDGIVNDTKKALKKVEVPLFPRHEELELLAVAIEPDFYASLSGPQRFALMNIAAQMHTIKSSDKTLMDPGFELKVERVYTDRIYFSAKPSLLDAVKEHGEFDTAPAGLHRYRVGSYKQKRFRKGNLQLSYDDKEERVRFDADIDLYRGPLSHLFGEVLVNHLTGSKTDQFKVKRILDERNVAAVGGFTVETLA